MKVFVTGFTGFLGNYLVEECIKRKYHVTVFVHSENMKKKKNAISNFLSKGVKVCYGDIIKFEDVKKALKENYDIVFHLASIPKDSPQNFIVDINGTKNLFRSIKENKIKVKKFLYMSTTNVIGPQKSEHEIDESFVCEPQTKYGISKYKTERLVKKFCKRYEINYIIIRATRIYGPRDWQKTFLTYMKLVKMGIITVLDNLPINLVYVKNLVHGIFLSLHSKNETFIISDENTHRANEIANLVEKIIKPKFFIRVYVPKILIKVISTITGKFAYGINDVRYSVRKAKQKINYKDVYSLEEGLKETISWYKNENML